MTNRSELINADEVPQLDRAEECTIHGVPARFAGIGVDGGGARYIDGQQEIAKRIAEALRDDADAQADGWSAP
jgi:hypothetical protein